MATRHKSHRKDCLTLSVCMFFVCMCLGSNIISMRVVRPEIRDPDQRLLNATDVAMVTS